MVKDVPAKRRKKKSDNDPFRCHFKLANNRSENKSAGKSILLSKVAELKTIGKGGRAILRKN